VTPQTLGTIGIYVSAALASVVFIAFITLARFWRSGRGGWLVFTDLLLIAWVLDMASIAHLFDPPWFSWLRVGTFAFGFPAVFIWRFWIIFDLQTRRRRRVDRMYGEADSRPADEEETHAA
jgi:hypothetical protein